MIKCRVKIFRWYVQDKKVNYAWLIKWWLHSTQSEHTAMQIKKIQFKLSCVPFWVSRCLLRFIAVGELVWERRLGTLVLKPEYCIFTSCPLLAGVVSCPYYECSRCPKKEDCPARDRGFYRRRFHNPYRHRFRNLGNLGSIARTHSHCSRMVYLATITRWK